MFFRNFTTLSNLILLFVFCSLSTDAAKANEVETKKQQSFLELPTTQQDQHLISQSLGHQEYKGEPQMSWYDYQTGTIVGVNGSVASVVADDGTLLHAGVVGSVGDTVLIVEEDGKPVVLEAAHPAWVGTLEEDYDFIKENDSRIDPPLEARTAPLWRALGY